MLLILQKIFSIDCSDPHPKEDNGDDGNDEEHEEGDGDPDEGGGVQTQGLRGDAVGVDDDLLLPLGGQLELDVAWRNHPDDARGLDVGLVDVPLLLDGGFTAHNLENIYIYTYKIISYT